MSLLGVRINIIVLQYFFYSNMIKKTSHSNDINTNKKKNKKKKKGSGHMLNYLIYKMYLIFWGEIHFIHWYISVYINSNFLPVLHNNSI